MCTQIHIVYTMYTTLVQWVGGGGLFTGFVLLLSSYLAISIFKNHVKCNNDKTQYYLQKVFSEIYQIMFKTAEIDGSEFLEFAHFLVFFLYPRLSTNKNINGISLSYCIVFLFV